MTSSSLHGLTFDVNLDPVRLFLSDLVPRSARVGPALLGADVGHQEAGAVHANVRILGGGGGDVNRGTLK